MARKKTTDPTTISVRVDAETMKRIETYAADRRKSEPGSTISAAVRALITRGLKDQ